MVVKLKIYLLCLLSLLAFNTVSSLANNKFLDSLQADFRFQQLPNSSQLSHLVINDIVQDDNGFIWIATANGLNRYDGQKNVIYLPSETGPNSISHQFVKSLVIDDNGYLWAGTAAGLNRYNPKLDNFEVFNLVTNEGIDILDIKARKIFVDSSNRLWLATVKKDVFLISADRRSIQSISLNNSSSDSKFAVYDFVELEGKNIYLATTKGVYKHQPVSNKLVPAYKLEDEQEIALLERSRLFFKLDENSFLVSTKKGLFKYIPATKNYSKFKNELFYNKKVISMQKFDQQNLLIGTLQSGMYLVDLLTAKFMHFEHSSDKPQSLIDNQVFSIFQAKDNQFWIGTNLGISILAPEQKMFGHIKTRQSHFNCLSGNTIYAILLDQKNNLWVASFDKGVNKINLNSGSCKLFQTAETDNSPVSLKSVVSLYEDALGNIWIATLDQGVLRYSQSKQVFQIVKSANQNESKNTLLSATDITGDQNGNVWISTYQSGVFNYHDKTDSITNMIPTLSEDLSISVRSINGIATDNLGNVWLATNSKGLWKYSIQTQQYQQYIASHSSLSGIPASLYTVNTDRANNIWVGSKGKGAFKLNPESGEITSYSLGSGLLSNDVLNIQQDSQGNMWFYTDEGLSRLTIADGSIHTYLEKDGMQADAFTTAGFFDNKTGILWTGGINGLNRFRPKDITKNKFQNDVTITNFELFYKKISPSIDKQISPLQQVINQTKSINLNYDQNVFAFSFTAMEFKSPEKINYKFMLDGYDSDWNLVNSERRYANYTNIDPGSYTFRIKASNVDGAWSDKETSVAIIISNPWWQTPVAYLSYIISSIICLYLFISFRTKSLTKRASKLERSIKERTHQLASEKTKVEDLLSLKNEEFANVSHEFRTPLTLILGPIAEVIKTNKNSEESKRLNIAQRNGYRLLRMVDQLLNLETFKVKSITHKSPQATGKIIHLLADAFSDLALEKQIKFIIGDIEDVDFEFTPDALEKIVVNLLSNSIKYSKPHDEIKICSRRTDSNELLIEVKDTGIGIPEDKLERIFDRYNRVLDSNSEQVTGAGIGLSLVKSLVEFHKGHIEIESQLGKGTRITIYLPIIGEVENADLTQHANEEIIAMELMSLTQQHSADEIISCPENLPKDNDKPLILIIEDNDDMRQYIVDSISHDYQTITASDGAQGVQLATEQVPDLIISDVMMPVMDGYEATQKLRANAITNHIPIILLTARGDRESRLKGWKEKADEYITKPFDVEELRLRLVNLLEIRDILKKRFGEIAFSPEAVVPEHETPEEDQITDQRQLQFINQLNDIIEQLYIESNTSVADIASAIAMSERQLFRKLKSVLDMTPADYLRRFRLHKAQVLLAEGQTASYTAFEVGFSSQSYFGKCFKAQFGISPSDFKKN